MKYIDKNKAPFATNGRQIIDDFIASQAQFTPAKECKYFLFTKTPFKNLLRDLLIDQQVNRCCYCMRDISPDETTTLEHVIPKSCDKQSVDSYLAKYPTWFNNVHHFGNLTPPFSDPLYPHVIAYDNLIASCKGDINGSRSSLCCNNRRGNVEIVPLPFDPDISEKVMYMRLNGEMRVAESADDTERQAIADTIEDLGLNEGRVREIRMLWFRTKRKNAINFVFQNDKRALANAIFETEEYTSIAEPEFVKYFTEESYWKLFCEYKWFAT
ncbi:MAG: hypothetical protein ACRDCN_00600 [Tannerellaceae bacterium]